MKLVHVFLVLLTLACLVEWTAAAKEKKKREEEEQDLRKVDVDFSDPEATKKWVNAILEKGKTKRFLPAFAAVASKVLPSLMAGGGGSAGAGAGAAASGGSSGLASAFSGALKDNMGKMVEGGMKMVGDMAKESISDARQQVKDIVAGKPPWATPVPLRGIDLMIRPGQAMINNTDLDLPLYEIKADLKTQNEAAPPPPTAQVATAAPNPFVIGLGAAMMNGCYGTGYKFGDPCYAGPKPLWWCENLMEAATYVGVGFDGRGVYGPESRKANVLEYRCKMKQFYIGMSGKREDVPDPMQIAGIYDTTASSLSFASKSTYRSYLESQSGTSGSFILFSASVESAYGSNTFRQSSKYLSIYQISIKRFEVFLAKYESKMLEPNLLREFMDLPSDYYTDGAPYAYQEFIFRWGTHFVESAEFGGHLEIQQTSRQNKFQNQEEFQMKAEAACLGLLGMRASSSTKAGISNTFVQNVMSMRVLVQGGNSQIAQMIADGYSRDVKNDLHDWILSLDEFPKPYRFRLKKLTDLFTFTSADLFPSNDESFGCEAEILEPDPMTGQLFYMMVVNETDPVTNETIRVKRKKFCSFQKRARLTEAIRSKRISLELATAAYLGQGPIAYGSFDLRGREDCFSRHNFADKSISPTWNKLLHIPFRLRLMLPADITNTHDYVLHKLDEFKSHFSFRQSMWYYVDTDTDEEIPLLDAHVSKTLVKKQIAVGGLYLTFNQTTGLLSMTEEDYKISRVKFPTVPHTWTDGRVLGFAELYHEFHSFPCHASFNNGQRINYPKNVSNCLTFMAAAEGAIYVVFAASPELKSSWYTVVINPNGVAIYKGDIAQKIDHSFLVMGLGSRTLFQSYFVCISYMHQDTTTDLILEYGKSEKTSAIGTVYVTYADTEKVFIPTYYAFGVGEKDISITRARQVRVPLTDKVCGPRLKMNTELHVCLDEGCHEQCHPIAGCNPPIEGVVHTKDCVRCRNLKDTIKGIQHCVTECRTFGVPTNGVCVTNCPDDRVEWDGDCVCNLAMKETPNTCIEKCPTLMLPTASSVDGAYQCDCEIKSNDICVTECDENSVLQPTGASGFYECKKFYRGRVEIYPGQFMKGGTLQPGYDTPEKCAQRCAYHKVITYSHCMAFTWYANTKQCEVHGKPQVCDPRTKNKFATHFKRVNCALYKTGELDAEGRRDQATLTKLIEEGEQNTLSDCVRKCQGDKCIGVNYNVDTGACQQVLPNPSNNWCPTAKHHSYNWVFLLALNGLTNCKLVACSGGSVWWHIFIFWLDQSTCLSRNYCVADQGMCELRGNDMDRKHPTIRYEMWQKDTLSYSYY